MTSSWIVKVGSGASSKLPPRREKRERHTQRTGRGEPGRRGEGAATSQGRSPRSWKKQEGPARASGELQTSGFRAGVGGGRLCGYEFTRSPFSGTPLAAFL